MANLSFKVPTEKTFFLVALVTVRHVSKLHAVSLQVTLQGNDIILCCLPELGPSLRQLTILFLDTLLLRL